MRRAALLTVAVGLALSGCGGEDVSETASDAEELSESVETVVEEEVETAAGEAEEEVEDAVGDDACEPATTAILTPIANRLTVQDGRLRNGFYVRSERRPGIYFVSAEVDGAGLEGDGDIGTWATEDVGGSGAIYAADSLARKHSNLRDARQAANVTLDDEGLSESRECAGG